MNLLLAVGYAAAAELILPGLSLRETLLLLAPLPLAFLARWAAYRWVREVLPERAERIAHDLSLAP